jgi:hypothetical protein
MSSAYYPNGVKAAQQEKVAKELKRVARGASAKDIKQSIRTGCKEVAEIIKRWRQ